MRKAIAVTLFLLCNALGAAAWGNRGHQLVALIGYLNLDPDVRTTVDNLIKGNPCYSEFQKQVSALPAADQNAAIFMLAATWPDRIKLAAPMSKTPYDCQPGLKFDPKDGGVGADGRFSVDIPPAGPEASQNIGYLDNRRHQYWHFIDTPISLDGTTTAPAYPANVLTEWQLLTKALGSDEDACLKSYDLAWVEHLTGDMHQPLHDAEGYSSALPHGDEGGNAVKICSGSGKCDAELHAYWDDLPGSDASLAATLNVGKTMNNQTAPDVATLDLDHPENWVAAATALAKSDAYAPPFDKGVAQVNASDISDGYHNKAEGDMKQQIFLAGHRLAALLNQNLKGQKIGPLASCAGKAQASKPANQTTRRKQQTSSPTTR